MGERGYNTFPTFSPSKLLGTVCSFGHRSIKLSVSVKIMATRMVKDLESKMYAKWLRSLRLFSLEQRRLKKTEERPKNPTPINLNYFTLKEQITFS